LKNINYKMCKQCKISPVYEFTNKIKLCKNCFIKYFQKKVLYTIRKFKMIKKDEVIGYEKKRDFRGVVLFDILLMFSKKAMIEIIKLPTKKKINKKAVSSTIDSESDKITHILIKGKTSQLKEVSPINKKQIKPLYLFLDEEVRLYAKLKKLKFKEEKIKQDNISSFINDLEKKHPEIKRAIVNSYLELYN
tara:strand:+ start:15832 stop:16404 length:573 start_codon:yes stop_codon:yes gene_type:complete